MGRLLEGFWDCKYCGTKRIGGSKRQCPNCGKARGDETKFYLDTTKNRYVPEEKAAKINRNPDWICDYCGQLNSDDDKECVFCGASRTEENLDYFQNQEKRRKQEIQKETPVSSFSTDHSNENKLAFSEASNFFSQNWKPALAIILIVACIFGIFCLFQPKEYEITISQLSWERCINIEQYQTVEESDWYLPSDARLIDTRLEYSHSEQVLDHYETRTRQVEKQRISGYESYVSGYRDLGNGYFEEIIEERPIYETYYETETYEEPIYRSEPVYRTKYYYEIDKWLYARSVTTSGVDKFPYWGETNLSSDERTSTQSEKYMVKGIDLETNETISFYLSFEDWSSIDVGQNLHIKISFGYGEILE